MSRPEWMKQWQWRGWQKIAAVAAVIVVAGSAASVAAASSNSTSATQKDIARARAASAPFHDIPVAERAQYARFVDVNGVACIDMPGMGAMGVHYVNGSRVGDGIIDPAAPEAVVYQPDKNGRLTLGAVEYLVVKQAWDAQHDAPPSLFGQTFSLTTSPNRFGLPDFYSLHVWLWKDNPAGMFSMWNPALSCDLTAAAPKAGGWKG